MKVVIAAAIRTPIAAFQGGFSSVKGSELGAVAIKSALQSTGLEANEIDYVFMGNVLSAGMGQAPARQATIFAGLSEMTPAVTLNKMCGSGLEAIIQGARAVALGDAKVVVAGGMESMTNAPYLIPGARSGLRMGDKTLIDSMIHDGLWDVYNHKHMGSCAERCARDYEFSREAQDEFAIRSFRRAQEAISDGSFAKEICPVEVTDRKGNVSVISEDEGPARVDFDKLPGLRPAFEEGGTVTAANASSINDGAAALILTSEAYAQERGLPILAQIKGYSSHARAPEEFPVAPVDAMHKLF
ncbi:MAG: acetyl-CoA C-acyltransferase, partial [Trueperaceae bacterium]|nr:acetyl-CoA C-acyltransferase [Trueperaceae bacterium]